MGHYDDCRPGYCPKCGAGPGNIVEGICQFCDTVPNPKVSSKFIEKIKKPIANRLRNIRDPFDLDLEEKDLYPPYGEMDDYIRQHNASEDKVWYRKGKSFHWSDLPVEEK